MDGGEGKERKTLTYTRIIEYSDSKQRPLYSYDVWEDYVQMRAELKNLKDCQREFLALSITGTAVLGIGRYITGEPVDGLIYLFPLVLILPAWVIFFDKAVSINRLVGYLRALEQILFADEKPLNYYGFERGVDRYRKFKKAEEKAKKIQQAVDDGKIVVEKKVEDNGLKPTTIDNRDAERNLRRVIISILQQIVLVIKIFIRQRSRPFKILLRSDPPFLPTLILEKQFHYWSSVYITFLIIPIVCLILCGRAIFNAYGASILDTMINLRFLHTSVSPDWNAILEIIVFIAALLMTYYAFGITLRKLYTVTIGEGKLEYHEARWEKVIFGKRIKKEDIPIKDETSGYIFLIDIKSLQ